MGRGDTQYRFPANHSGLMAVSGPAAREVTKARAQALQEIFSSSIRRPIEQRSGRASPLRSFMLEQAHVGTEAAALV
jgi:hypothetical protein